MKRFLNFVVAGYSRSLESCLFPTIRCYLSSRSENPFWTTFLCLSRGRSRPLLKDSCGVCLLFKRLGHSLTIDFAKCWVGPRQTDNCQFLMPVLRAGIHLSGRNLLFFFFTDPRKADPFGLIQIVL